MLVFREGELELFKDAFLQTYTDWDDKAPFNDAIAGVLPKFMVWKLKNSVAGRMPPA